ncbi:anaerobic ribonucleoside-triphosphate reductase, partial [Enterococcus sp. S181_ASV_20]|nr:anaerobic ribonucleoside-triphosphate reductase [Enterococcus sp. S181_ASV_20]
IQKAILQIRIEGLGSEKRTAIFPKLIFTLRRGTNLEPTDPNYDIKELALECATKRMYPDILNYDKLIELTGSFKVPMGCRS